MNKCRFVYLLLVCFLVFPVVGCSSTTAPADTGKPGGEMEKHAEPKRGGTITIGVTEEPDTLDAQKTNMNVSNLITGLLGGSLLSMDSKTLEIKPYLAESYVISEDGKTWTFTIRSGVTFHDGTPLTAASFKMTFERALAPETASTSTGEVLTAIQSVSAPDDKTLILHLKEPSATLLSYLAQPGVTQPLSMEALAKYGKEYGRNPVGVGPWKFESWKTGESITLVRNDAYRWADPFAENQGPPRADKLVFKFIKDAQTTLAALESGTIDLASVAGKDAKQYQNSGKFTVLEAMSLGVSFVQMNLENEILQDVNVRRALNMAINKAAIIQADLQGEGVSAHGPLPREMFGYDPAVEEYDYKYSPEEAKKLLEAAGWQMSSQGIREKAGKPLRLNLLTAMSSQAVPLIQSMLKEVGVDVKVQHAEFATVLDASAKGQFDLNILAYTEVDPDVLYLFMHSSQIGSLNHSHINNPQLDALLEKGRTTVDRGERKKIYADIQKIAVDQAYWIPYAEEKKLLVVNKRLQGVKLDPIAGIQLGDSWVNE